MNTPSPGPIAAAIAAFQRGDLDQAQRIAEAELEKSAQLPLLHHLLGLIDCRLGRFDRGLERLKRASDAEPDNIKFRISYASLLVDLGRHQDALAQIDEGSRLTLGHVMRNNGPISVPASDTAPDIISSGQVTAIYELGLLLDRTNQVDGLRRLLEAAKKAGIAPEALGLVAASLALRDGKPEDARRLLSQDRGAVDDAHRHRLTSKMAEALGDAEGAFAAAGAMNRAVADYDLWRRRGAHYRAQLRSTAEIVTPEWASRIRPAARRDGDPDIAFLVGFPRSGTTLLDTFLMGHPQTCVVEEGKMLESATGVVSQSPGLDWPPDLVERARDTYLDELSHHVPPGFSGLVIDKHPLNMLRLAVAFACFPSAKVIFAQRHPCDVVLSGFMQSFQLNHAMASFLDIADAADFYDAAMSMWTRSRDAVPLPGHTVVYEHLIADPGSELRRALQFLGLDWHDGVLDHQATAKDRGSIITASYDQVVQPLSRAPSGRWRRYRKQMEPVLATLLPWADRLGYWD